MDLAAIQTALQDAQLDGWLFYDHHHRDPLAYRILGLDASAHVTRRWFYLIPALGEPRKLVHRIESGRLDSLSGEKSEYSSWQELEAAIKTMLSGATKLAMQYSPRNAIMYVGLVDAGTIEVLHELGKEIVSSADLVSRFEAVLTGAQIDSHFEARRRLDPILAEGFARIGQAARSGAGTDELTMVNFLKEAIEAAGMVTEHGPNVSAGPNSADSHYEPTLATSRPIRSGDFVLIDIWARLADDPTSVWYDITWTGVVDREPTAREQLIFSTVRDARDAAIATVQLRRPSGQPGDARRPPHPARHLLFGRARPLLPGRVRHPLRGQHDHARRLRRGHRPHSDGVAPHLNGSEPLSGLLTPRLPRGEAGQRPLPNTASLQEANAWGLKHSRRFCNMRHPHPNNRAQRQ
jgi:Xaa-Pro aminopeptidase